LNDDMLGGMRMPMTTKKSVFANRNLGAKENTPMAGKSKLGIELKTPGLLSGLPFIFRGFANKEDSSGTTDYPSSRFDREISQRSYPPPHAYPFPQARCKQECRSRTRSGGQAHKPTGRTPRTGDYSPCAPRIAVRSRRYS